MPSRFLLRFLVTVLLMSAFPQRVCGGSGSHQVKALFIFNFLKYIDWPVEDDQVLKLVIIEDEPTEKVLREILQRRTVNSSKGEVVSISSLKELEELSPRLVFYGGQSDKEFEEIQRALSGKSVLFVTEREGWAEKGAMINLYQENKKVKFEVNLSALRSAGLSARSQLLKLGKVYQ